MNKHPGIPSGSGESLNQTVSESLPEQERCTWAGCEQPGVDPRLDRNGKQWACLCEIHALEMSEAEASLEPKKLLSAWVKAQGGAKAATRRMLG